MRLRKYFFLQFFIFFFLFSISVAQAKPAIDILVFSPHPDDETLACGGTILKALKENKKVKIVFLTNGDAYSEAASAWFKKKPEELTSEDYITFGQERQKEALWAAKKLSLKEEDIIFLSYPDKGLLPLWKNEIIYDWRKKSYNRDNLLSEIKEILTKYKPHKIYIPHPLDGHPDHRATTLFVNLALKKLGKTNTERWIGSLEISSYLIHLANLDSGVSPYIWPEPNSAILKQPFVLSQKYSHSEVIVNFKYQKLEALKMYQTQLNIKNEKVFLESFIKDNEIFWNIPFDKRSCLKEMEEEWERIARIMQNKGYNVNFGVVADVADDIKDMRNPLAKKERIYSAHPCVVTELAFSALIGMDKAGVIPVVKHFPGLGSVLSDTHISLPKIEKTKKELFQRDIMPFQELINRNKHFWIMVDHAVYPRLSDKPASLSYEIQTELLRNELGFKGIVIVDELLYMQAIREYAFREKIKEPFIGEIIVRAFQAGADIALFYTTPSAENTNEVILHIIESVEKAVGKGVIKEEDIDASVKRILKEKERIFGKPLEHLLNEMSLRQKIAQKLFTDMHGFSNSEPQGFIKIFKEYNLGGILLRNFKIAKEVQENSKIPMFIATQHEGGMVNDFTNLNLITRSAYLMGEEFERLILKAKAAVPPCFADNYKTDKSLRMAYNKRKADSLVSKLDIATREAIISSLLISLDEVIGKWIEMKEKRYAAPDPDYLSPLSISKDKGFEIKAYENLQSLPVVWIRKFPDEKTALCAYHLFKKAFESWPEKTKKVKGVDKIIFQLKSLRSHIEGLRSKEYKGWMRVLCLATHPDDEDAEALIYFGKKFDCETNILLATTGEGGENQIGSALYKELGFLRTEEMDKAASILGVKKVHYLGKTDFGYTSSVDETIEKWGREDTLEKLVYFIRLIKPHIIITKHNEANPEEHGQHRALAILAKEAFDLSGDPKAYPAMAKDGLLPWQPVKLYQRAIKMDTVTDRIVINPQDRITSANKTIHKIAIEAIKQHNTQGDWQQLRLENSNKIVYQLVKSKILLEKENSFFDGIKIDLPQLASYAFDEEKIVPSGISGVMIVKDLKIGLLDKNNNTLPVALKTLGYDFKDLDNKFIEKGDLSQFDTIILGQGIYAALPSFFKANNRFLEFVEKGGNLVVFLQSAKKQTLVPYPLRISFNPISDENAEITLLDSEHPLFNFPNKILVSDFTGWVQERGLSFPFEYSNKYTELLSCLSDKGELVKGGYLVAPYGKGSYIFTTYSWYRQFRDFHLGAYKNLANMLAYGVAKDKIP